MSFIFIIIIHSHTHTHEFDIFLLAVHLGLLCTLYNIIAAENPICVQVYKYDIYIYNIKNLYSRVRV